MTNYASNRLIITGPADELSCFLAEHVNVSAELGTGEPVLEFASLIPVPSEIAVTMTSYTRADRNTARKATGYEDMDESGRKVWGTSREPNEFDGRLFGDALYDCRFDTALGQPVRHRQGVGTALPALAWDPGER